jgi:hypothetical protein
MLEWLPRALMYCCRREVWSATPPTVPPERFTKKRIMIFTSSPELWAMLATCPSHCASPMAVGAPGPSGVSAVAKSMADG